MYKNDSDSALEDLSLHDIVPGTFVIEKSTVRSNQSGERSIEFSKESAREGTHVTWPIGRIEKQERIEVVFEIQGDSESEYKVADAQDYHGATFGDEVDEEPNLPDWVDESTRKILQPPTEDLDNQSDSINQRNQDNDQVDEAASDGNVDLSIPQVQQTEEEDSIEIEDNMKQNELDLQEPEIITPDVCPVCGTEASVGASSCETCSFQFG